MIVIGFPGIGKSTIAQHSFRRIDLESSNFWYDGNRPDDWYAYYCQVALDLSRQGYTVFVSSHTDVRDFLLENTDELVFVIYPSLELEEQWIRKLEVRYNASWTEKDKKAWDRAKGHFIEDVTSMCQQKYIDSPYFKLTQLNVIDYKLDDIITEAEEYNRGYKSL